MKSFQELSTEHNLIEYLYSEFGTMYFEPGAPREKETIIRHLDGKLTLELLPAYVQLYNSIQQWLERNQNLKKYVFMPNLIEVGKDYIIRPFYVYDIDIRDYSNKKEPVQPPEEYEEMIRTTTKELSNVSGKEGILRRVLRKSLLEPSGKTYFEDEMNKFVIVEPKISLDDLQEWQHLSS